MIPAQTFPISPPSSHLQKRLLCVKFMNEVRAYKSQGLITLAWAKNSTIGPVHAPLQSISSPSCSTPAAFPIRGLSQAEAASGAEWCQTVWWFCDRARWGLWWDEAHFHSWAEQRCEFRWKDGVMGLLVLTSHIKIMEIRINWDPPIPDNKFCRDLHPTERFVEWKSKRSIKQPKQYL